MKYRQELKNTADMFTEIWCRFNLFGKIVLTVPLCGLGVLCWFLEHFTDILDFIFFKRDIWK